MTWLRTLWLGLWPRLAAVGVFLPLLLAALWRVKKSGYEQAEAEHVNEQLKAERKRSEVKDAQLQAAADRPNGRDDVISVLNDPDSRF